MKMKSYNLVHYFFVQFVIMIFIAGLFFLLRSYFKTTCYVSDPCASAQHCVCNNNTCECEYIDSDGNVKKITCDFSN